MTSHDSTHLVVCHMQGEPGSSGDRGDGGRKGPPGDQVYVVTLHGIYSHEPKHFDILTLLSLPPPPTSPTHTQPTYRAPQVALVVGARLDLQGEQVYPEHQ